MIDDNEVLGWMEKRGIFGSLVFGVWNIGNWNWSSVNLGFRGTSVVYNLYRN
jgi:hypothetical protein